MCFEHTQTVSFFHNPSLSVVEVKKMSFLVAKNVDLLETHQPSDVSHRVKANEIAMGDLSRPLDSSQMEIDLHLHIIGD